jgi:hypothetical protein
MGANLPAGKALSLGSLGSKRESSATFSRLRFDHRFEEVICAFVALVPCLRWSHDVPGSAKR